MAHHAVIRQKESFTSKLEDINKEINQRGVGIDGLDGKESTSSIAKKISEKEESEVPGSGALSQCKKMVCDVCKKSFLFKRDMGEHVRVHYVDRPFKCRVCDLKFKQRGVRRKHELRHRKDEKNNKDGQRSIREWTYKRKEEWNEHITRMDDSRVVEIVRDRIPSGKRSRDRPCKRWTDDLNP
ncbi:hypothetical protein J437_LFUL015248 [Ladona fulva]|uniref:C2H2-type domain-containing protein n=1 Tax=Ladona fulva TaxID=123851 RepID=A0A8K0KL96_LADFU|nr:hypothetical protein J437_LFUL015248 [Ladona fulva]